ncbi:MAG TPA: cupin domain-containing protein [Gemmatimonadales bacterium]|jgi:quercetin dioxygenase-like cupin family protein|nr:cupin domain-containing protein [Gemmatimonadales bacterium]
MHYFIDPAAVAVFGGDRYTKADLARGNQLFLGLNCFEPGQRQATHTHAGADKFYLVVSGKARITVGGETQIVERGAVVWAPADVPHGVDEALERTVLLVAIAPPPNPREA